MRYCRNIFIDISVFNYNLLISCFTIIMEHPFYCYPKSYFPDIFIIVRCCVFSSMRNKKKFIQFEDNPFIENNYVSPYKIGEFRFPKKKRNLILIVLESIETTFASKDAGGLLNKSAIPELQKLAFEPDTITFTNKKENKLGGVGWTTLASWSYSARFAMLSGLPYKFGKIGNTKAVIPGAYTLLDLLHDNGYKQYLIFGHPAKFMGIRPIYEQHGNVTFCDSELIRKSLPKYKKMRTAWGLNDIAIFDYARMLLKNLTKSKDPYTVIIHTVDTHFPNGIPCKKCKHEFEDQYYNTVACSSREVKKMVDYIKKLDNFNDTTLALISDHYTMAKVVCNSFRYNPNRRLYNAFINSAVNTTHTRGRKFNTFDWYPTLVRSLGIDFNGNKLGLGTDLFSGEKTLSEKIGEGKINNLVTKPSDFYSRELMLMPGDEPIVHNIVHWKAKPSILIKK